MWVKKQKDMEWAGIRQGKGEWAEIIGTDQISYVLDDHSLEFVIVNYQNWNHYEQECYNLVYIL